MFGLTPLESQSTDGGGEGEGAEGHGPCVPDRVGELQSEREAADGDIREFATMKEMCPGTPGKSGELEYGLGHIYNLRGVGASNAPWNGFNEQKRRAFWPTCRTTEYLLGRILG